MELSAENIEKFFPYYLTAERRAGLLAALKDPPSRRYYAQLADPEPLQGDGWRGLQVIRFEDGSRDRVQGIVLTNSCDLAGGNQRVMPVRLNFVPLINLDSYLECLRKGGVSEVRVSQHASDVRAQIISDLFYLPADYGVGPERIALFQEIYTIPMSVFSDDTAKARIFSLSDVGFYLFVFKLSVHFCRLHENIDRSVSGDSGSVSA